MGHLAATHDRLFPGFGQVTGYTPNSTVNFWIVLTASSWVTKSRRNARFLLEDVGVSARA
jgi:hypothetical protein